jgi:hypothetical protein
MTGMFTRGSSTIARFASVAVLGLAAPVPAGSDAGGAQRIEFAPGTDHASVQGTVDPGTTDRYVLWADRSQTLLVVVASLEQDASVAVVAAGGEVLDAGGDAVFAGTLPTVGDVTVEVSGGASTASHYALAVYVPASGQEAEPMPRRIEFASGTDRATISGTFTSASGSSYVLRADAGQVMTFSGLGSLRVDLTAPDGTPVPCDTCPGDTVSFRLPQTGDYVATVRPGMGEVSTFTFTVTIPATDDGTSGSTGPPQRVEFVPGTSSASMAGDIAPATTDRYVLRAAAGQTMTVRVAPIVPNITFTILAPDGTALASDQVDATVVLPAVGDYLVVVETTSSGGPYEISFSIV